MYEELHKHFGEQDAVKTKHRRQQFEYVCPKCKSHDIRLRWHIGRHQYAGVSKERFRRCGETDYKQSKDEHMHYYCRSCFYDWIEDKKKDE